MPQRLSRSTKAVDNQIIIKFDKDSHMESLFDEPCRCCGSPDHSMLGHHIEEGVTMTVYLCPIIVPIIAEGDSLDGQLLEQCMTYGVSAERFANVHGYNRLCVEEAISDWVKRGDGYRLGSDIQAFRENVWAICGEAHESWQFKGTSTKELKGEKIEDQNISPSEYEENWNGRIFCDMDGVLADCGRGVEDLFKLDPNEISQEEIWSRIEKMPNFYGSLPWMEDGVQLWESIKHLNPTIISAAPEGSWAANQKLGWVRKNLGGDVRAIFTTKKQTVCSNIHPKAILIDDTLRWCKLWEQAGGVSVYHVDTTSTLQILLELGVDIRPHEDQDEYNESLLG